MPVRRQHQRYYVLSHSLQYLCQCWGGTVVQLCVARNKRRQSAACYKGVAKVTTRRAHKGFTLKYNPDSHWSATLYRGLKYLHCTDGRKIMNLSRHDCAGLWLDILSTHRMHQTPVVKGHEILATHTDFVNSYPSSYNFQTLLIY